MRIEDWNDKKELFDFTERVFQYYNGRINTTIPAKLNINMQKDNLTNYGYYQYPNIVSIHPMHIKTDIMKYEQMEMLFLPMLVNAIIHELYHVDQYTTWDFIPGKEKLKKIEQNTRFMTITYILSHTQEIYNNFGVHIPVDIWKEKMLNPLRKKMYGLYERTTPVQHIYQYFNHIFDSVTFTGELHKRKPELIEKLKQYGSDPDSIIGLIISEYKKVKALNLEENNVIVIKDKDKYISVEEFDADIDKLFLRDASNVDFKYLEQIVRGQKVLIVLNIFYRKDDTE